MAIKKFPLDITSVTDFMDGKTAACLVLLVLLISAWRPCQGSAQTHLQPSM
ncbi:unnamed protein product [Camellia sinensis]